MEWQKWQNEILEREGELAKYALLPEEKDKIRKSTPIFDGVLAYFPDAIREVARCSAVANAQHNGDAPMHWNKEVSFIISVSVETNSRTEEKISFIT